MESQAAFLETDRRSVSSNAGLREPRPVVRLTFFSATTMTAELTQHLPTLTQHPPAAAPLGDAHQPLRLVAAHAAELNPTLGGGGPRR
jgi:hypothetical protein